MELRQLQHFLVVLEEGSFTAAAARLHMVQSSLSSSVAALERELGTPLLTRTSRGVELTDAGVALLPRARAIVRDMGDVRDAIAEVRGVVRGTVSVASAAVPRAYDLLETVVTMHELHPGVRVQVRHDGTAGMAELVQRGELDFAVVSRPAEQGAGLTFEPLLSSPLVLVVPEGHALLEPGAPTTAAEQLASVVGELLDVPRGWWSRGVVDRLCAAAGIERPDGVELDSPGDLVRLVRSGVGVAYGPLACLDPPARASLGAVELGGVPEWQLGIVWRDPGLRGAAGRAFLDAYREQCARAKADEGADPDLD